MNLMKANLPFAAVALVIGLFFATGAWAGPSPVEATLLADTSAIVPGQSFHVGVLLKMAPGWHTYWINPGETGNATTIELKGPAGLHFGEIAWPIPSKIESEGSIVYGYEGQVLLSVPVAVGSAYLPKDQTPIEAKVTWLCCKETCMEGGAKLSLALPGSQQAAPANAELFKTWVDRLPVTLEQAKSAGIVDNVKAGVAGGPIHIVWKKEPGKVQWFPISTEAVSITDVKVTTASLQTEVTYKLQVFKAQDVVNGHLGSVVVFEHDGKKQGIEFSFRVTK